MKKSLLYIAVILTLGACKKDLEELEKYKAPDWLKGKLYTQVESQPELGLFSEALKLTGMDTIINTSGLFTVFAPTDEAFSAYLSAKSIGDGELSSMPIDELTELVTYHIVQNSWSKQQLSKLNLDGWIDEDEGEITQRAYKRETLFQGVNKEYNVTFKDEGYIITEEPGDNTRMVYTQSRKYVPIFFQQYFETYRILYSDYEFYFDRPFEGGFYFAGAKIINEEEIPAENGYLYIIDKVVSPLPTAEEIMEQDSHGNSYREFLSLVHEFPDFTPNLDATFEQAGASEGEEVDTLFNLSYPELAINIHSEITDPGKSRPLASIQYHNSMFAPTDQAFNEFLNNYIQGPKQWGSLEDMPRALKAIIVNSYMVPEILYESDIDEGFQNAERDVVYLNKEDIIYTKFGSNVTFNGLSKAIIPRAFSSVSAPVYLRRNYFTYMTAIQETNVLDAVKKENQQYSFFVIPDLFAGTLADSSLIVKERRNNLVFTGFDRSLEDEENIPINDLRKKILNHVGTSLPEGVADIEFVENLAGNYLVFDNQNNTVRGTSPTTYGLNGDSIIFVEPTLLDELTDNGETYEIPSWFSFSNSPLNSRIFTINPRFVELMEEAGLANRLIGDEYDLTFINPGASYSVFVPSEEALNAYNTDTLKYDELRAFLLNHFVPDNLIFTDGKVPSGEFLTLNPEDENQIYIETGPDFISILDSNNNEYSRINVDLERNNLTATSTIGSNDSGSSWNFTTTGVVHTIDKVLISSVIY